MSTDTARSGPATRVRRWMLPAAALLLLVFAGLGLVRGAGPDAAPSSRAQVDAVAATIRCPTCQGLSVKDSPSVLADGSRQIIEEQVAQGRSADQIRQYFVDRYGDYILLSPDPAGPGVAVWVLPGVVLVGAGVLVLRWQRRGRAGRPALVGPDVQTDAVGADRAEADGDALLALHAFSAGTLDPDDSPAGEALREALVVRIAAETDDLPDRAVLQRADLRLGAAYRRYTRRRAPVTQPAGRAGALPRRAVTALVAVLVVAFAGTALAMAVRTRGATDLPTGDLPGGPLAAAAAPAAPGLAELTAAARARPDDPDAWLALGRALDAGAQFGPALAAYDRSLQLRPQADDVAVLRAGVLVRAGSPTEALPVLEQLAARYPDDPDTVLLLGIAQHKTQAPAAPDTLRRYLELAPYSAAAAGVRDLLATP